MSRKLALITGASSGIGEGFARAYADLDHDLVLVARRRDRLEKLAAELKQKCGVDSQIICADLAEPGAVTKVLMEVEATGRTLDVLVNNAGYTLDGQYTAHAWEEHAKFMRVILDVPLELMHRVLPGMKQRKYGRIINIASIASLFPALPANSLYCAFKAALLKASWAVQAELEGSGVHVTAICPGPTRTEIFEKGGTQEIMDKLPQWVWYTAREMAEMSIQAVERNKSYLLPGVMPKLQVFLLNFRPYVKFFIKSYAKLSAQMS